MLESPGSEVDNGTNSGINSSGNKVNLGTQTKHVDSRLNGSKPANSTWKWSTK